MLASPNVKRKRVEQLTTTGQVIAVHPSVSVAARSLGQPNAVALVSRCCRGKVATFAGFVWRYVEPVITSPPRARAIKSRVEQVTTAGEVVAVHASIAAAARALGKNAVSIRECCHRRRSTAYGFWWRFIDAQD